MKRTLPLLALLASLARPSFATLPDLLGIFAAAAVTQERLKEVPVEFAGIALLATYSGQEPTTTLVNLSGKALLAVVERKEAYWGGKLEAVLQAQKGCRSVAEGGSGLVVASSLEQHARECADLMTARQVVELILQDLAQDKMSARLIATGAWNHEEAGKVLARKKAAFAKIASLSSGR